jgi:hypothetical protein
MTDVHFLGRVKREPHRGELYRYATVEPLVQSDPHGTQWIGPVREATRHFPTRGYVHWHDAPIEAQLDSVWQFTVNDHPSERGRREHFQLESAQEAIEVLDFRAISDETALRSNLTGEGIALSPQPVAKRVLLWMASGLCVGPLLLRREGANGHWVVDTPVAHRDSSRMPVWRLAANDINRVRIDRDRYFVSPRLELGQSAGIQNWASDAQVARSILARLRKMDSGVAKAIVESDRVFREYLERIEAGRLGGGDPAIERARLDRLRGLRFAIQRDAGLLKEAAAALLSSDSVRVEIGHKVEEKVAEEVRARRAEIELALDSTKRQLLRLEGQLTQAQAELDAKRSENELVDSQLSEKRRVLDATVAAFDQELSARLQEVARRPEAAFADVAVMRALLALSHGRPSDNHPGRVPVIAPVREFEPAARELSNGAPIQAALVAHASGERLSLHAMLGLHAIFAAGVTPVVIGSVGYELLRAYASAVAGGRLHWISIGSSVMEPQDLLGRYDGPSGRIVPAACGLLDVVRDASQSGRLHVVVLEGFNRAPCETYLSPILEVARSGRAGDEIRAIPLASPQVVSDDDPYRHLAQLAWPPSVLVACLPTDGSATLPVSSSVWRFLSVLDAEDRDRQSESITLPKLGAPELTEISPVEWKEICGSYTRLESDLDSLAALRAILSLPRRDVGDAARIRDVLSTIGLPGDDATAAAIASIMIPRSGADAKTIEQAVRASGLTVAGWRVIVGETQRLRS